MEAEEFEKFLDSEYTFDYLMKGGSTSVELNADWDELNEIDDDLANLFEEDRMTHVPSLLLYGGYTNSALMFWVVVGATKLAGATGANGTYFEHESDSMYVGEYLRYNIVKILEDGVDHYIASLRKKINRTIPEDRMISLYDKFKSC